MSEQRDPVDRVVDMVVAVPWSLTVAIGRAVPAAWRAAQRRALPMVDAFADAAAGPGVHVTLDESTDDAEEFDVIIEPDDVVEETARDAAAPVDPGLAADELPIEEYDALAARQVVARLADLFPEELDAVERYEIAHRHRQTVLHRIAQLRT